MASNSEKNEFLKEYFDGKSFEELLSLNNQSDPAQVKAIIEEVEKMMKANARNITYTQLRNILQVVKKEEFKNNLSSFYKVIPKLAYMEARPQKKEEGKKVITFIRQMAGSVSTPEQYKGFEEVMNTLVAYHKLYG